MGVTDSLLAAIAVSVVLLALAVAFMAGGKLRG